MKRILVALFVLSLLITACSPGQIFGPTFTPTPTNTSTPTNTPTIIPTSTPTKTLTPLPTLTPTALPPTETPIPQPASLTGAIYLLSDSTKPFVSLIELREKDSYKLIGKGKTDSSGIYKLENIGPGTYELWVLITAKASIVSGCADVATPDDSWKIGIKFGDDKAMTIENAYLSKALSLIKALQSPDLKAQGIFAVREGFEIKSGMENKMDVTLICK